MNPNRNLIVSASALAILLLTLQTVAGLAPGSPTIALQVDPSTKVVDTPPGGSLEITINVLSQESYEGDTQLSLVNPPSGVTATFAPNPVAVPAFDQGNVKMTINIASTVPEGKITLTVNAKSVADSKITKTLEIALNIGKATTTTSTTTTSSTTTSTSSTTTSTTTQPSTTSTSSSSTTTSTTSTSSITTSQSTENAGFPAEITYAIIIVVVIAIAAVAYLTMRKKK